MSFALQAGHGEPLSNVGYETLRRVSRTIRAHRDINELFRSLADDLRPFIDFVFLRLFLYDTDHHLMRMRVGVSPEPPRITEFPPEGTAVGWVFEKQEALIIPDMSKETRFPGIQEMLKSYGIRSHCTFPLTTAHRRLGTIAVGSEHLNAYSDEDLRFLGLVSDQIALAIDDALHVQALQSAQVELEKKNQRLQLLLELNNRIVSNLELQPLLEAISVSVRRVMQCDGAVILLAEPDGSHLRKHALDFPDGKPSFKEEILIPIEGTSFGETFRSGMPWVLNRLDPDATSAAAKYAKEAAEGMNSFCEMPLISRDRPLGVLGVVSREENAFDQQDLSFLSQVAQQVAIGVENALAYEQIAKLKNELAHEKVYLESEIRSEMNFADIVGSSAALVSVLQQVETVAPTDSAVLLLGETGTGKELMARAIHERSPRRSRAFVKVNCAAIPTGLLESEMFGHEKGAFTGAVSQRIGRFELAHGGTIFLDEIGEIPLEVQPKLLRVLQEREFERLGNSRTLHTDARVIAATNCDLQGMVDEKRFRADLFYRLNVFPLFIPALRDRRDDISMLVSHFVQLFARRLNKKIETVATTSMNALIQYSWPGNIRELQNVIERAVLVSNGPVLKIPPGDLKSGTANSPQVRSSSAPLAKPIRNLLQDVERKQILDALERSNGVVAGPKGAATLLGLKRSTLQLRMKKLKISPRTS
jgi:formate hydrogenlyase transcriptional activator